MKGQYHFSIEGIRKLIRKQSYLKLKIKISIDSKRFSKQNVPPDNVFLFEILHITAARHICLTQGVILSSTSNSWAISSLQLPRFTITWDLKSKLYLTSGLSTLPDNPGDLTWDFEPFLAVSRLESEIACSRLRDGRARGIEKARKRKKQEETGERGRRRNWRRSWKKWLQALSPFLFPFFSAPSPFSRALHFRVFPTIWEPGTG